MIKSPLMNLVMQIEGHTILLTCLVIYTSDRLENPSGWCVCFLFSFLQENGSFEEVAYKKCVARKGGFL